MRAVRTRCAKVGPDTIIIHLPAPKRMVIIMAGDCGFQALRQDLKADCIAFDTDTTAQYSWAGYQEGYILKRLIDNKL